MKKLVLIATLFLLNTEIYAQVQSQAVDSPGTAHAITIGTVDKFYSKLFSETREIWVSVPSDFHPELKGEKFPIALVLDGPDHFYSLVGMLDRFSRNPGNEACPPMIVVGLVNTDRERDFYPDLSNDLFSQFMTTELLPYIDTNFPTQPFRILIGHSLGGLRTIHTSMFNEDLFKGFIAIDSSLGQTQNAWYNGVRAGIKDFYPEKSSIYVAMAQTMPGKMVHDTALIKRDTTRYSNHMRRIMEFSESLNKKNNKTRSKFYWEYFPDETHQSVTQLAMYNGVKFLFGWYKPAFYSTFFDLDVSPVTAVEMYDSYYRNISARLGYEIKPPVDASGLTEYLIYKKQPDKATAIAELTLRYYTENEMSVSNFRNVKWRNKKDVSLLLEKKSAKEVCQLCRKESLKKVPDYNVSEGALNALGYQLINDKKKKDALLFFKLNTELHPRSANAYDSYGECLLALNRKDEAVIAYRKSLELNPLNSNAEQAIKKISN